MRHQTLYVEAAEEEGATPLRIIWRHILPNSLSPVIVQSTFLCATAVLLEASLSFLGVGAPPQIPSWGVVLAEGKAFMRDAPWLTIFPGVAIALDPRLKDL